MALALMEMSTDHRALAMQAVGLMTQIYNNMQCLQGIMTRANDVADKPMIL